MKHLLIVLCMSFCCVTQFVAQNDNVVYPYGDNVEWRYHHIWGAEPGVDPQQGWCSKYWMATDTLINDKIYTTLIFGFSPEDNLLINFLRVDSTTLETFFYSGRSNQEYNITMPATLEVGDTIELTNLLLLFEENNQCNNGDFSSLVEEIYQNLNLRVFDIVESIGDGNPKTYWLQNHHYSAFIPGFGFLDYPSVSGYHTQLRCVVETEENTIFYTNGGCLNSIPEQKQLVTTLFPNPATNKFSVTTISNEPIKVSIFHLNGILVKQIEEHQPSEFISCNELEPGMYIVVIEQNQFVQYLNLIID